MSAEDDVRILLGIARLGESDLAGWWNTRLYSRAGRFVLSRSFPRTWKPAAGQLLMLSCARWHGHAFSGRPSAIHLYSPHLPALGWANAWLAEQKTTVPVDPLFDELANWTDKGSAASSIDRWLPEGTPEVEPVAGNLRLGFVDVRSLQDPAEASALVQQLAKCYVATPSPLQIPYFDAV
ncbi:BrxE family protein [Mycobacterium yunnanensis]|uniref:BrxE family protein n=1 Tax=Mycobacterium yunnanensis TaxID=368477 RepID=A0A9X3C332_9MYCO|nr:BrxE family protein [Mycobacterium yunnanensis]